MAAGLCPVQHGFVSDEAVGDLHVSSSLGQVPGVFIKFLAGLGANGRSFRGHLDVWPDMPVILLHQPRDNVLEAAEGCAEVAMGLNQPQPFILIETHSAPVALQLSTHAPILPDWADSHYSGSKIPLYSGFFRTGSLG